MNALKVLTLAVCMGTAQKTVPNMHELQQLCNESYREVLKELIMKSYVFIVA